GSTTRLELRHEKPTAFEPTSTPKSPCIMHSETYPSPIGSPTDFPEETKKQERTGIITGEHRRITLGIPRRCTAWIATGRVGYAVVLARPRFRLQRRLRTRCCCF